MDKDAHLAMQIATKLYEAGLSLEDAELAGTYCMLGSELPGIYCMLASENLVDLLQQVPSEIFWRGFTWDHTPQGHAYWYERVNLL